MRFVPLFFVCELIGACAQTQETSSTAKNVNQTSGHRGSATGGEKLDRSYAIAGSSFEEGGYIVFAAKTKDVDGSLVVCGARIQSKLAAFGSTPAENIASISRIAVDGRTVLQNLSDFNVVKMTGNVNGQPTTCLFTGDPWTGEPRVVEVVVPPFVQRHSPELISRFSPGPVAQIIGENPPTEAEIAAWA